MAHLLKGRQGGEGGEQGLLLAGNGAGIRQQGTADGGDDAAV